MKSTPLALALALACCVPALARAQEFDYNPPGTLTPGSGTGRVDTHVYIPGMRFPIEQAPAYANSQVWGNGGMNGGGGSECDAENYSYPWSDNYCETRSWDMPLCPAGVGHQGQDIRARSCQKNIHWTVAAVDSTVVSIGSYSIYLQDADGTLYGYLHFELNMVLEDYPDGVYVPTYMSLIQSYEALLGVEGCSPLPAAGGIIDNADSCFVLHGPPTTWRYVTTTGYDGDLYWSYAWENAASNWAEWAFEVSESGEYVVDVYVTPAYAQSQDTRYTVLAGDQETEVRANQSAGDGWLELGTYDFTAGTTQRVAVYDGPGEDLTLQRQFVADAIRLTRVGGVEDPPAEPTPEPSPEPVPDVGSPDVAPDLGPDVPDLAPDVPAQDEPVVLPTPDAGDEAEPQPAPTEDPVTVNSGCGCNTGRPGPPTGWLLPLLGVALALGTRRSRR